MTQPSHRLLHAGLVVAMMLSAAACGNGGGTPAVETPSTVTTIPSAEPGAAGTLWAWGNNFYSQLGDGSGTHQSCKSYNFENYFDCSPTPVRVDLADVIAVSGGAVNAYALTGDGRVWAWGSNLSGQLGDGSFKHPNCVLTALSENADCSPTPVQVTGLTGVIAVSGGGQTGYALKSDGTVWAWGDNESGQLGDGNMTHQDCPACSPAPVQVTELTGVIAISGGSGMAYALKADGTVWAWGNNSIGQLGDGSLHQNCAESYGQSGTNDYQDCSPTPVQVAGLSGVIAISGGGQTGYALKHDGTVWAWGDNTDGELGDGNLSHDACAANRVPASERPQDCSSSPVQVAGLSDVTAIASSDGGTAHALRADGTVWAWGYNYWGQLGDGIGTHTNCDQDGATDWDCSFVPVQVAGLNDATAVAVGTSLTYALKQDGTVWVWGQSQTAEVDLTPVQVAGLAHITAIGAGWQTGYALQGPA